MQKRLVTRYATSSTEAVENHILSVPPALARCLAPRLQELLGYNVYPPFIGYVDGRHPAKLLAEAGPST